MIINILLAINFLMLAVVVSAYMYSSIRERRFLRSDTQATDSTCNGCMPNKKAVITVSVRFRVRRKTNPKTSKALIKCRTRLSRW